MRVRRLLPLSALLFFLLVSPASAARLYLDPQSGTYGPGDTFIASIRIDNEGECINAVHVDLRYPVDSLRAVDFSRGSSILTLWVEEPKLDTSAGVVTFSGGIPGGYCGRIPGDPVISNVLGRVVFTVVEGGASEARVGFAPASSAYLNDGEGTKATLAWDEARFTLVPESTGVPNEWLDQVGQDIIPPDPFLVSIESTRGVYGGNYYIVFSTVDKQSGLDHYELYERGVWRSITSPHELRDQALRDEIRVKAIDKAGNERFGEISSSTPQKQTSVWDFTYLFALVIAVMLVGIYFLYRDRRNATNPQPLP